MGRLGRYCIYYIYSAALLLSVPAHADLSRAQILAKAYQVPGLRELISNLKQDLPVDEVQHRISDVLHDRLPPEVERAIYAGPDKVDALIAQGQAYLPSEQLDALKSQVLALPVVTIPNEVYAPMLAGSAAQHFLQAFASFPDVNPYELQRGMVVTKEMIWQVHAKQGFNMSLGQLLDMADSAVAQFGGLENLGKVEKSIADVKDRVADIEHREKALEDKMVAPIKQGAAELRSQADGLRQALIDFQSDIAAPAKEWVAGVDAGLHEGTTQITDALKNALGLNHPADGELVDGIQPLMPSSEINPNEKSPGQNEDASNEYDPVLLHNGEFVHPVVDVTIPGRGLDFQFKRSYRSRTSFMGRLGWNWTHNFEESLQTWKSPNGAGLTWIDPEGRKFFFKLKVNQPGEFESPAGVFAELKRWGEDNKKFFVLKETGGITTRFDHRGLLQEKCDRFHNCLRCERDDSGKLLAIVDTVGRRMTLAYDVSGRITQLTDNSGRIWRYLYDESGDLTQSVSPATDLFPDGIATTYYYDAHRMTQIRDPKGRVFLKNVYGTTGFANGQIIAQSYGAPDHIVRSRYVLLKPKWIVAHWADAPNVIVDRVDLRNRRGVVQRSWHNAAGNLLFHEIIDANGIHHPGMHYGYNADGMRVSKTWPSGLTEEITFYRGENRLIQGLPVKRVLGGSRVWVYEYSDSFGDVIHSRTPEGIVTDQLYNALGALVRVSVQDGKLTTLYRRNPFGQMVSMTDPRGIVTDYAYDAANLTQTMRDATTLKLKTSLTYDAVGNITVITLPNGGVRKFDVDAQNLIRREVTPLGYERSYDYDAHGDVTAMHVGKFVYRFDYDILDHIISREEPIDATHSAITHYSYDVDERLTQVTFPEGNRMRMTFDAWENLTMVERGAGTADASFTQYQYDADGNVVGEVDGLGNATELERNIFGETVAVIYPNQTREEIGRDAVGRVVGVVWKDSAGVIMASTKLEKDVLGLSERELNWDSQNNSWRDTQRKFDATGNLVQEILPTGSSTILSYDGVGNRVRVQYPMGLSESWRYNALGLPVLHQDVANSKTQLDYDLQGRLTSRMTPNGAVTKFSYDDRDNLTNEVPAEGASLRYEYDGMGRRTAVAWGERVTRYGWDGNGRLLALVDPLNRATRYTYDALDRMTSEIYPDGGVATRGYNPNNNVTRVCHPNGDCIAQAFDAMGNILSQSARGIQNQFHYDALGRLIAAQSGNTASQFLYSSLSEVVESSRGSHHLKTSYDVNGLRRHMELSDGKPIDWKRDALGRLTQVDGANGFHAAQTWGVHGPDRIIYGNGRSDTYHYDVMGNVSQQNDIHYSYNLIGNLISKNDTRYSYDPWQQLVQAGNEQWLYNLNGERTQSSELQFDKNGNLIFDGTHHYHYDAMDRLNELSDASGKVIAHYIYDALGRRTFKFTDHATEYLYDGWEPIEILEEGKLPQQFVRGDALDETFGLLSPYYFHKDRLGSVSEISDASGRLVEQQNYSPFGLSEVPRVEASTGPAAAGNPVSAMAATGPHPLASPVDASTSSMRKYAGQLYDTESGLYYMRNRYYAPKLGQFLTRDPIGYKNTFNVPSSLNDPFSFSFHKYLGATPRASEPNHVGGEVVESDLYMPTPHLQNGRFVEPNLHMYVGNNPLNFIDPMGLYWEYSQRTGQMTYVENTTGERSPLARGYAGHGLGVNNPDMQRVKMVGPIPQGRYAIGPATDEHGLYSMRLTPVPGPKILDRGGFFIHWDNKKHNRTASKGCIIISNPNDRLKISKSGDNELRVIQ